MKKILFFIAIIGIAFTSCKREDSTEIPTGYKFTAKLGLIGEITESPGFGSRNKTTLLENNEFEQGDLIGIEILKGTTLDGDTGNEIIASGLFDNLDAVKKLEVTLCHNIDYVVRATLIKGYMNNHVEGDNNTINSKPFLGKESHIFSINKYNSEDETFKYNWETTPHIFENLAIQTTTTSVKSVPQTPGLAEEERWYFEKVIKGNYNSPSIDLNLKRVSFKINYTFKNFNTSNINFIGMYYTFNDGEQNLYFGDSYGDKITTIANNSYTESIIYTCPDVRKAYACNLGNTEIENVGTIEIACRGFAYEGGNSEAYSNARFNRLTHSIKPNHTYYVTYDTNNPNNVNISLNDEWQNGGVIDQEVQND